MIFRQLTNDIINKVIINNQIPKIIFFQIGCYPSCPENNNHEYPVVLDKYKNRFPNIQYFQILIDKMYENKNINEPNTFIYPNFINEEQYNSLIELSHFLSNFNVLSIMMEFTSITRKQYFQEEHKTEYLYITPSNCIINTVEPLFNPILKLNQDTNKFYFYRPDKELSLNKLLSSKLIEEEREFIEKDLMRRKNRLRYYLGFLSIMRMKIEDGFIKVENNYNRNYSHFYMIKKNILKRLEGYEAYSTQVLFEEFERSDQINLETYIYDLVFRILYDNLVFLFKEENIIMENYDKILFSNDKELKKCIDLFSE